MRDGRDAEGWTIASRDAATGEDRSGGNSGNSVIARDDARGANAGRERGDAESTGGEAGEDGDDADGRAWAGWGGGDAAV